MTDTVCNSNYRKSLINQQADMAVTKVVNTNTLYASFLAAALHLSIEVIFCNWKQSIVQTDVILHSKIFLNFLHKETRHCDGAVTFFSFWRGNYISATDTLVGLAYCNGTFLKVKVCRC